MSSLPDYNKLPVEEAKVSRPKRPSFSKVEDPRLCEDEFFKDTEFQWSWVGKGCLCGVEYQGKCWACWAFVAAEAIIALYFIKRKEMKLLSKQHVIDCLYTVIEKPRTIRYHNETGCYASHYNKYYQFAMKEGVYPDSAYPYVEKRTECRKLPNEEKTKIKGFKKVANLGLDKEGIEGLIRNQPISGCVQLTRSFQTHSGKHIYMGRTEEEEEIQLDNNNEQPEIEIGRHAVLVVGYGVEDNKEYYLIKNSWGEKWGYKGYARVERSVVESFSYPVLD